MEASKHYLTCATKPTEKSLQNYHTSVRKLLQLLGPFQQDNIQNQVEQDIKTMFTVSLNTIQTHQEKSSHPTVNYKLHPEATVLPKICEDSNGLDIPLQQNEEFAPYELKKVNL
jgi:hypothetical protein